MTSTVPVRVRDFDVLVLEDLLVLDPLSSQLFPFGPLSLFAFSIRQERGVYCWVLGEFRTLGNGS